MYYLQSRYYNPEIGRFISRDDAQYHEGDTGVKANLYAYCANNPVMNSDPNGHWIFSIKTSLAGIILDFFITILLPYITTAFKATRLVRWARACRWCRGLYNRAISRLSKLIYNAMDRILYDIMGRAANAATRAFTLSKINRWIGNILNFSIGYGIAWIIDCVDHDGRSGGVIS